jgi:hypothetical protein
MVDFLRVCIFPEGMAASGTWQDLCGEREIELAPSLDASFKSLITSTYLYQPLD